MGIHIGLLIWKEMKKNGITRDMLAQELSISKGRIGTIINSSGIDTQLLMQISIILKKDFFAYYSFDKEISAFHDHIEVSELTENEVLKSLIQEKAVLLELAEKTMDSQRKIIKILERSRTS
jgi:hypothetical protein